MKRLLIVPAVILCSVTSALAGASSENRLDEKALEGPEGKGAHTTDPNIERSGTPGPKGPSDQSTTPSKRGTGYDYNPGAAGSGSGTSGGTSGTKGPGTSGSGSSDMKTPGTGSEKMPHQNPGSAQ